jgi:hypothetical protein
MFHTVFIAFYCVLVLSYRILLHFYTVGGGLPRLTLPYTIPNFKAAALARIISA